MPLLVAAQMLGISMTEMKLLDFNLLVTYAEIMLIFTYKPYLIILVKSLSCKSKLGSMLYGQCAICYALENNESCYLLGCIRLL